VQDMKKTKTKTKKTYKVTQAAKVAEVSVMQALREAKNLHYKATLFYVDKINKKRELSRSKDLHAFHEAQCRRYEDIIKQYFSWSDV
jgi:hypothetical protein